MRCVDVVVIAGLIRYEACACLLVAFQVPLELMARPIRLVCVSIIAIARAYATWRSCIQWCPCLLVALLIARYAYGCTCCSLLFPWHPSLLRFLVSRFRSQLVMVRSNALLFHVTARLSKLRVCECPIGVSRCENVSPVLPIHTLLSFLCRVAGPIHSL
jgi:hypothetical protein